MSTIRFDTKLFQIGDWTILKLPESASKQLPSRGQVMVKGTVNDAPVQTALEPDGLGSHWFRFDKTLQSAAKAGAGDTVSLEIESTKEWPEPVIPADIQAGLEADAAAREMWKKITPMARHEWIRWIVSTNNPETRKNHIVVARSKMRHGERRPCCFNRNMCCVPEVSKSGVLLDPGN